VDRNTSSLTEKEKESETKSKTVKTLESK